MILGRVVGNIWSTRKNEHLRNLKLAIVRPYCWYNPIVDCDHVVATDQVGAEVGQDVLVCIGQPGRWAAGDDRTPVEASIMAIVDDTKIPAAALGDPQIPFSLRPDFQPTTLQLTEESTMAEDRRR
jgi:ethanolamine utilization protein EutN